MADSPRRFDSKTFQEWAAQPLTQAFFRLLRDQRDCLAAQWGRGLEMDSRQQTKAQLMGELSTLNWADVDKAYKEIDEFSDWAASQDAPPAEETGSEPQ